MTSLIRDIVISIGALTSLVGLVFAVKPSGTDWTGWHTALLIVSLLLGALSMYFDVQKFRSRPIRILPGPAAIRDYMFKWINEAGAVAIFSRDLSWVNDDPMRNLLKEKAAKGELTLALPKSIPFSESLEESGAKTLYYSETDYATRSRFTLVNVGRNDTRLAIGRTEGGRHIVEEFSAGDHPAFYLAQDMLDLVERLSKRGK